MKKILFGLNLIIGLALLTVLGGCATPPPINDPAKLNSQPRVAILSSDAEQINALLPECLNSRQVHFGNLDFVLGEIHGEPVVLVNSGKGMINAAAAAQQTIDLFQIKGILSIGLSVGLRSTLAAGDIVVPSQWAQPGEMLMARQRGENYWDINTSSANFFQDGIHFGMMFPRAVEIRGSNDPCYWFAGDPAMLRILPGVTAATHLESLENLIPSSRQPAVFATGNGISSQAEVDNPEYRDWLEQTFKAEVGDTETAAVAQVALTQRIPFLAIRGVAGIAGSDDNNRNDPKILDVVRRNVADFTVLFLNNYARDVEAKPTAH